MYINIEEIQYIPTLDSCVDADYSYDDCVLENALGLDDCRPTFMNLSLVYPNLAVCRNQRGSIKALEKLESPRAKCKISCLQTKILLKLVSDHYFKQTITPWLQESASFYVFLPHSSTIEVAKRDFLFISYLAAFGGWSSLFCGISFTGATLAILTLTIKRGKSIGTRVDRVLTWGVYIGYLCILIYNVVGLTQKLMAHSKATVTTLEETNNRFQVSVCAQRLSSELTPEIWNKSLNLSTMVEQIQIMDVHGHLRSIKDNATGLLPTTSIYIPNMQNSLDFCHTLDLKDFPTIVGMEIVAKTEIQTCFHAPGQLLDITEKTCVSNINQITASKHYDQLDIFGSRIELKFIIEKKSNQVQEVNDTYDACIVNHINKHVSSKLFNGYPDFENNAEYDLQAVLNKAQTSLWNQEIYEKCSYLQPYKLRVKYMQSKYFSGTRLNTGKPKTFTLPIVVAIPQFVQTLTVGCIIASFPFLSFINFALRQQFLMIGILLWQM